FRDFSSARQSSAPAVASSRQRVRPPVRPPCAARRQNSPGCCATGSAFRFLRCRREGGSTFLHRSLAVSSGEPPSCSHLRFAEPLRLVPHLYYELRPCDALRFLSCPYDREL